MNLIKEVNFSSYSKKIVYPSSGNIKSVYVQVKKLREMF